jgi:hypothetical protein
MLAQGRKKNEHETGQKHDFNGMNFLKLVLNKNKIE